MNRLLLCVFSFIILIGNKSFSQDIHFSQFNENSQLLNPAYTGMFDGTYRANLNYKNQWATVGNVYETYAASADFVLFKNYMGLKSTGIGISFFQDVAGSSRTKTSRIDLNISQTVYLSENTDITLGVQFGYLELSANYVGLSWGSQYNGVEYNGTLASGERFTGYAQRSFDLSAGLLFRVFDENLYPLEIGVSAYHLTQPKINALLIEETLPYRFNANVSKEFNIESSNDWGFKLQAYAQTQNRAREILVGGLLRKDLGSSSKYTGYNDDGIKVYAGAMYRIGDAFIPLVKVLVRNKLSIGMSYDFTLSKFSQASLFRGGPEFSLSYIGPYNPMPVTSPKSFD